MIEWNRKRLTMGVFSIRYVFLRRKIPSDCFSHCCNIWIFRRVLYFTWFRATIWTCKCTSTHESFHGEICANGKITSYKWLNKSAEECFIHSLFLFILISNKFMLVCHSGEFCAMQKCFVCCYELFACVHNALFMHTQHNKKTTMENFHTFSTRIQRQHF